MKFISLVFLLSLPLNLYSQNGWYWTNQSPITNNLFDICFANDMTGYIVGNNGVVLKTIDGGYSWSPKAGGGGIWLYSVFFTSPTTGYTLGIQTGVLKTTNGANSWMPIIAPSNAGYQVVYFINQNTGFVGGQYTESILKTTNAGNNWFYVGPYTSLKFTSFCFINETTGFAGTSGDFGNPPANGGQIFKSTNTGQSWYPVLIPNLFAGMVDIKEIGNSIFAISSFGKLYRTSDLGSTWDSTELEGTNFYDIAVKDSVALIPTSDGKIYRSSDYGLNWNVTNDGTSLLNRGSIFTNNLAIVVGHNRKINRSTDEGLTWTNNQNIPTSNLNKIAFLNFDTGFAVGQAGAILFSSNQGNSWNRDSVTSLNINDINITPSGIIYLAADSGKVIRSTDSGISWEFQSAGITENNVIKFFTDDYGICISEGGHILKTYNGGQNWLYTSNVPIFLEVLDAYFFDSTNFLVSSYGGDIFKTTNGGSNFSNPYGTFMLEDSLTSLEFINQTTGFCSGSQGTLLKTTNAGDNWTELNTGIPFSLYSVKFTSEDTGYISGAAGKIYKTYDGGQNWVEMISNSSNPLKDMCFNTSNVGFIVGTNGTILKTVTAGEIVIGITQISSEIPDGYYLSYNYPNPFNPVTNIEFKIPESTNVTIRVFDITGREISTLINEIKSAGSYKINFNGDNLASGVYFYRIETERFVETKRMVLLK